MVQRVVRWVSVALGVWLLTAGTAAAAVLEVTSTADSGAGSLRQALTTAEGNGEPDTIVFTVTGTITLLSALPTIATDVVVDGPGAAQLTISGGGTVRVFRIEGGSVEIRDLTIADGLARGEDGADAAGNRGGGGGGGLGAGGGVFSENAGLILEGVVFSSNVARGGTGGAGGPGCNGCFPGNGGDGGASSLGASGGSSAGTLGNGGGGGGAGGGLTTGGNGSQGNLGGGGGFGGSRMLIDGFSDVGNASGGSGAGCGGGSSTLQIAGDFAGGGGHGIENCVGSGGGGGGGAGLGGGLYVRSGTVTLDGVTFDGNEARRGAGGTGGSGGESGQGKGGGLFIDRDGVVTLVDAPTFTGNVADDDLGTGDDNDDYFNRGGILVSADLAVTKTDGQTTAVPGESVTYTLTASNAGPFSALGAVVSDAFPAGLSCSWVCTGSGGATCTAGPIVGDLDDTVDLPDGGTATYTAVCDIDPGATGTVSNTATVSVAAGITDPVPGNDSATDVDTLEPTADLGITKDDGVTVALPGDEVTYTIVAENPGPSDVLAAAVDDVFPPELTDCEWSCLPAGGALCTTGPITGDIADSVDLFAGSSVTYTATCTVDPGVSFVLLSNTATITVPAGVSDPEPGDNAATDVDFGDIVFADGFESGDTTMWTQAVP